MCNSYTEVWTYELECERHTRTMLYFLELHELNWDATLTQESIFIQMW